ncbi:Early nodulin-like protein [Actinidia chinensis var. chinensis]|uniref:Early nodulin-like protein n=1 Tax=Actinidia chinensis var. chinensis TaxID=1590841 RepID=A0A2R6R1Q3_ACTCC|nr:Early nodulin-like protein [Actinidia chinensis var. chinensis]
MEMGLKQAQVLILLVLASMLAVGMADKNIASTKRWNYGFNYTDWYAKHLNGTVGSQRIIVGGSENWHFGFNYTDWALKNGPFYLNDTLVFKYDPPVDNSSHPHSVYLLPNFWSYLNCDLSRAKRLADVTQGGGEGFEFRLMRWQPHYFACGESNGFHCDKGLMKFFVMPLFRRWHG